MQSINSYCETEANAHELPTVETILLFFVSLHFINMQWEPKMQVFISSYINNGVLRFHLKSYQQHLKHAVNYYTKQLRFHPPVCKNKWKMWVFTLNMWILQILNLLLVKVQKRQATERCNVESWSKTVPCFSIERERVKERVTLRTILLSEVGVRPTQRANLHGSPSTCSVTPSSEVCSQNKAFKTIRSAAYNEVSAF